ncbi:MBL fold metallo-hydrolase [Rubrivirga sp. S365]|uniref:MBL fold metallo-hydrolase n=1 Tax=Rubrivirga litoralis TaxID=3075598 RepID=A0ABU3BPT8_9BACT|nr:MULTISPECIES: MBL fold metallo-hydrolase [unclassified Rubrivirga]MDT0631304.1 MBL fold metallo-hydrolase [Rubrivirga sp. F394]MDT7855992.1 MBL fold metallo-hydrolase [Rubrivirga sp. S365]
MSTPPRPAPPDAHPSPAPPRAGGVEKTSSGGAETAGEPAEGRPAETAPALTVTLLGTGTSTGVPVIGCRCAVCTSDDPRDRRLRTSAHVVAHTAAGDVHLQIDTGPDFREQALRAGVSAVDALLVTHEHFDHVVGLDDLRPFFFETKAPVPVFAQPSTADSLRDMFRYIFDRTYPGSSVLDLHPVDGPFVASAREAPAARVEVVPVPAVHGRFRVLGFRIGAFAYLTDVNGVPPSSRALLEGVETLVLDGLRPERHPSHFSFAEAAAFAQSLGARETWLTHVTHAVTHVEADASLPPGVRLGYDGLVLEVAAA